MMRPACCQQTTVNKSVICNLCRHNCTIADGGRGVCRVRENRGGILYSLVDRLVVAEHIDPIEKKPLYHLLPGSRCYSIAAVGCNFNCSHCQNFEIAKYDDHGSGRMPGRYLPPDEAVKNAVSSKCRSIAYTYTEPTVWFEYAAETAAIAAENGLYNIFVTNGYISSEALGLISPVLHAANIDLKGFTNQFYNRICGAQLNQVLDCIRDYKKRGIWIEITTLLIPEHNDDQAQLEGIARFIADELGADTPWHLSRFFPQHLMSNLQPTPVSTMNRAVEAGVKAGLRYIYEGNVTSGRENTVCPYCGAVVVGRSGYTIVQLNIRDGSCGTCGKSIPGIWS